MAAMEQDGMGWQRMEQDGMGWQRMEQDGGWDRGTECYTLSSIHPSHAMPCHAISSQPSPTDPIQPNPIQSYRNPTVYPSQPNPTLALSMTYSSTPNTLAAH